MRDAAPVDAAADAAFTMLTRHYAATDAALLMAAAA